MNHDKSDAMMLSYYMCFQIWKLNDIVIGIFHAYSEMQISF